MVQLLERELTNSDYSNKSESFLIKKRAYDVQYAPLYAERLVSMRAELEKCAMKKWDYQYDVKKSLVDLETNTKSIIIGTLYKEMKNKPNILKELADDENNMLPIQPIGHREKYIDDEDQLILEDEVQRIKLIDPKGSESKNLIKNDTFCTGLVLALLGYEDEDANFVVMDYCYKDTAYPGDVVPLAEDKYIVFLSGIELGSESNSTLLKLQMFIDFLNGDFLKGDSDNCNETDEKTDYEKRLEHMLANTTRCIIAGNCLGSSTQSKGMHKQAKYLQKNFVAGSVNPIKQLDEFLLQLTDKIDVDIMPGEFDPSNLMVPQQPLHHAMFTKTVSRFSSRQFHSCTNPYQFDLNQIAFLGTSGQFVEDIRRSTHNENPIDIMSMTLGAGHIAPTCPDTLACYPYYGKDPFILKSLPHVYFCGNQDSFQHEVFTNENGNRIQLLSLPRFSTTGSCVFFNLRTFESEEISF